MSKLGFRGGSKTDVKTHRSLIPKTCREKHSSCFIMHVDVQIIGVTYRGIILAKLERPSTITIGTASHVYIENRRPCKPFFMISMASGVVDYRCICIYFFLVLFIKQTYVTILTIVHVDKCSYIAH